MKVTNVLCLAAAAPALYTSSFSVWWNRTANSQHNSEQVWKNQKLAPQRLLGCRFLKCLYSVCAYGKSHKQIQNHVLDSWLASHMNSKEALVKFGPLTAGTRHARQNQWVLPGTPMNKKSGSWDRRTLVVPCERAAFNLTLPTAIRYILKSWPVKVLSAGFNPAMGRSDNSGAELFG